MREPVERKGRVYEAVTKASSLIGIEDLEKAKMDIYERVKNYSDLFEERRLEVIGEDLKTIFDILGYEGGDYFFAASIHEKLGIMPTFLDQDAFRYSLYLRRAVQYAIEEKVIDEFTDEDGTTVVKNRVQWLEDHFGKVFPKSGEEFLLSNAIYRKELRGREKKEIKKFLTALLFPLTKEEIPKEYKTLLGIEIEFF